MVQSSIRQSLGRAAALGALVTLVLGTGCAKDQSNSQVLAAAQRAEAAANRAEAAAQRADMAAQKAEAVFSKTVLK